MPGCLRQQRPPLMMKQMNAVLERSQLSSNRRLLAPVSAESSVKSQCGRPSMRGLGLGAFESNPSVDNEYHGTYYTVRR
jgi:hypothetical protein